MSLNKFIATAITIIGSSLFSCVSASAKSAPVSKAKLSPQNVSTKQNQEPDKIQPQYQSEFAKQLAAAGPGSEGWALFSDSSMGHNGQRWIIKRKSKNGDSYQSCFIAQQDSTCSLKDLTLKQFESVSSALEAADKLTHVLPTAFDSTSFEYMHAKNSTPFVIRVVFIRSAKPFPAEYENLIKAFNSL